MKTRSAFVKPLFSVLLCLALMLTYVPSFVLAQESTVLGDFTVTSADGVTALTDGTDYTYTDGTLTITTDTPVVIGMKDGVATTDDVIVTDSTVGETTVTFHNLHIDTTEDEAITVQGSAATVLIFSGTNTLSSADTGIDVSDETPLRITSSDAGSLTIADVKYGIACIAYSATEALEIGGNIKLSIQNCSSHAVYYRYGAVAFSGTPTVDIDTYTYAIYGIGVDIAGGTFTLKNDDGYIICSGSGNPLTLSGTADLHITEGERGLYTSGGKITITDSAKLKVYGGSADSKTPAIVDCAISSSELLINKNAIVDVYTKEDAISGGTTKIADDARVNITIACTSSSSQHAIRFDSPLEIGDRAHIDIGISGSKIYGLYDITDGVVNISGSAVVNIRGAYRAVYADALNLSGNAAVSIADDLNYAIYGVVSLQDSATLTAISTSKKVLYDAFTVTPATGEAYMVKVGASEESATTEYYKEKTTVSEKSAWRYFHASATDKVPVNVTFDANGGAAIDPITVTYGEKYGKLPSSTVTGLSGGDSNWYLVDENGAVTETKITKLSTVGLTRDHQLFVVRKVLAPTLKITLTVPGAISNDYQYYVPGNSKRILTVTVNNQNTDVLEYTYQWYKDGAAITDATGAVLELDGDVSDNGTYTVKVTATLKDGSGIVVTSNTASAEKEQKVKILHAANTLYYDANGGEDGPSSNYTGGVTLAVVQEAPTRTGYVFNGWNTAADGSGDGYTAGSTYTFAEDGGNGGCSVTLYAQWIKAYDLYVGGVRVTEANKNDVFGDGTVIYDAETNTLTLNGYEYAGEGYLYRRGDENDVYYAAIYSTGSLNVRLVGSNTIKNTADGVAENQYGDGVITEGDVTFAGDGTLNLYGSFGVGCNGQMTVAEGVLVLFTTDNGIVAGNVVVKDGAVVIIETERDGITALLGGVTVEGAEVVVTASRDGIYADGDVTITDSSVQIKAEGDGVYSYDGKVTVNSTKTAVADHGPWLEGTSVTVTAGGDYAIFAYNGLTVSDKLTVSTPEGGVIGELSEDDYTYGTVVYEGAPAKDVALKPLGYTVKFYGLKNTMQALVPAGHSLNETYCDRFGVEDFSEIFNTEKDGYLFGGWYTDESCTAGNEFAFDVSVAADTAVYAKWIPLHAVSVETVDGGTVTVSPEIVAPGETVVITLAPDEGKEVDTVTVTDRDGNTVTVTAEEDGTYSFIQPETEVTVRVTYKNMQAAAPDTEEDTQTPPTGDSGVSLLWPVLLAASGICLAVCGKRNRASAKN